jgi:ATP-binding cassette subfamily B protein
MSGDDRRAEPEGKVATLREVLVLVWSQANQFVRRRMILALGLVILSSVAIAFAPMILKYIVDRLTARGPGIATNPALLIALYVFSIWAARTLGAARGYFHAQADRRMYRSLSDQVFGHVMHLPLRFHLERQTGAINEILTNGLQGYQMVFQHAVYTLIPVTVELMTVVFILLSLHHAEFLALFSAALICYGFAFTRGVMRIHSAARSASSAQVEARAIMTDGILNYETVKYFTAEPMMRERFDEAQKKTESSWMRLFHSRMLSDIAVGTIFAGFLAATALYAAHRVQQGTMTVGDFVLVTTYVAQLVRPIELLGMAAQQLSQGFVFLEKMLELLKQPVEPPSLEHYQPMEGPGAFVFDRVAVAYRQDRQVLKGVSFTVDAGKTVAIVGSSGTGKSTLLRLLVRLIEADEGRIILDGVPINELPLLKLRQAIAVVPQDTILFNDTIGRNIAFGRWGSSQAQIEQAAKLACLHDFIMKLPEGYETRVGERGVKLSGGEKQRVSIARAVLKQPRIFVFDEATSSLDSHTEREILRGFREVSQTATTLVIAHRLSTIAHADKIVVLEDGLSVEQGTHEELLRLGGRYATLWFTQQQPAKESERHIG